MVTAPHGYHHTKRLQGYWTIRHINPNKAKGLLKHHCQGLLEYKTHHSKIQYSWYILRAQIFVNLKKSASEVMFAILIFANSKVDRNIFADAVIIHKFCKNLDLAHKTCYTVAERLSEYKVHTIPVVQSLPRGSPESDIDTAAVPA